MGDFQAIRTLVGQEREKYAKAQIEYKGEIDYFAGSAGLVCEQMSQNVIPMLKTKAEASRKLKKIPEDCEEAKTLIEMIRYCNHRIIETLKIEIV